MLTVANPIYDAVFKYLLEDERVARTLLSALLQREVVEVHVRKHEYTNGTRDKISMFRIDFGAQVRQDDGSLKLILIELQKTWLETETLRFRQYLGTQYADPDNIIKEENPEGYANASLLSKAKDLEGRLLVIHGAEDNTVVWQNSIEFIERCINNGNLVDYFIYPHHEHNVRGYDRIHLYEKMFDYYETFLK